MALFLWSPFKLFCHFRSGRLDGIYMHYTDVYQFQKHSMFSRPTIQFTLFGTYIYSNMRVCVYIYTLMTKICDADNLDQNNIKKCKI